MESTEESFSHTSYEPKNCFLTEMYVEFNQESVTEQRIPEQRFLEDVDYDDAAIGEMLFKAYREQIYHSQREDLSVGQSSSSVSEKREDLLLKEQEDLLWKEVKNQTPNTYRLGLCWTDRKSKSSPTVMRRLEDTNSRLIVTEEVYKIKRKDRVAAIRTSSCSSRRTSSTRSTTSS